MATKLDLETWIIESLRSRGGEAHLVDVARDIWRSHEDELRRSGDLFFTWQYDMRWAATRLRKRGGLVPAANRGPGVWALPSD